MPIVLMAPYKKNAIAILFPTIAPDSYFANVLVQMHMEGSNGSQTIVNNGVGAARVMGGNGTLSTSNKKFGSSSYVNGATSGIAVAPPADFQTIYALGSFDFTAECYVYRNSATLATVMGTYRWYIGYRGGWQMQIAANGALQFLPSNTVTLTTAAAAVPVGTWTHVAVTRQGNTYRFFVDGALVYTTTDATVISDTAGPYGGAAGTYNVVNELRIGYYPTEQGYAQVLDGYIDELRVSKGVARYTSAFTTQTTASTDAWEDSAFSSVSSLMHFENFTDDMGNPVVTKFTAPTLSTDFIGGSKSLNLAGTGYLEATNTGAFDFGTGDFTVECWMKSSQNVLGYKALLGTQSISGNTTAGMWRISTTLNGVGGLYFNYSTGTAFADVTFSTVNLHDGKWHHVAISRTAGVMRAFVDGTQVGTNQNVTANLSSGKALNIGYQAQDNTYWSGLVDELRVTKGVGRYVANFVALPIAVSRAYAIFDASYSSVTLTQNGLHADVSGNVIARTNKSIPSSNSKTYWEIKIDTWTGRYGPIIGMNDSAATGYAQANTYNWWVEGQKVVNTDPNSAYGGPVYGGDTIGILYDADAGTIEFFLNGVSQGILASGIPKRTYYPVVIPAGGAYPCSVTANFGQSAWKYPANAGTAAGVIN